MANSLVKVYVHFVWTTRYRACTIHPDWRRPVIRYVVSAMQRIGCEVLAANAVANHFHLLVTMPAVHSMASVVNVAKGASSRFINTTLDPTGTFQWQNGYSAHSVSNTSLQHVKRYIGDQQRRHSDLDLDFEIVPCVDHTPSTLVEPEWGETAPDIAE
ncbi:MAG: IS200/IS605 family transposase [Armatimonadaceae bacterium]